MIWDIRPEGANRHPYKKISTAIQPMKPCLISGERSVPLEVIHQRAARAATGLASLGVEEGDSLALLLRNDMAFFEASLAAARLGAYAVPVNWHNTPEELAYIFADSGAKAVVAHADLIAPARHIVPEGTHVFVVPTPPEVLQAYDIPLKQGVPSGADPLWEQWLSGFDPIATDPPAQRASMIYTSGTTGLPKAVRREPFTPEIETFFQTRVREIFGVEEGMRTVVTGTLYHSAPNAQGLAAMRCNAMIVLQPRFDPEALLALIEKHRITSMHMVPTMFVRLVRLPEDVKRSYDLSSLKWIIHGAAPCPPEVKREMIRWWGPIINEYYGSTEIGINTSVSSQDWLARPGTVGRPIPRVHIRILDDGGAPLPAGQPGQVFIRQTGMSGFTYHQKDEKRREIERDGYITVGDIGYLDHEGYLFLCDRKVDMVISGGVNIYPAEIEKVLIGLPGVEDCAVFGIPDEEFGEALMAVVQPSGSPPPEPQRLQALLRERLAGYKVPRRFEFRDALPREDSGKIFKRKLRDPFWEKAGRSI